MNYTRRTRRNDYYLDVSDYVLTDPRQVIPSPRRTPVPMHTNDIMTPSNVPLIIEIEGVQLSPYFAANGQHLDIEFYDFTLELDGEDNDHYDSQEQNPQQNHQNYRRALKNQVIMQQPSEQQKQSENEPQYPEIPISRYNLSYFNQALIELNKMKANDEEIKSFVLDYITEEDMMNKDVDITSLESLVEAAKSNLRPVGPISWLERKFKVSKYIQKKKRRVWKKKISYDCRKRVADNRLRVKGKFVTKKQACNMLGVDEMNEDEIKMLLENKITRSSD